MTTFDRVKKLADEQKISLKDLAIKLNMGSNIIYKWKAQIPSGENLQKVADYFDVSTDYLLGRTETPSFSAKDERDIQRMIDEMVNGLSNEHSLAFMKNGESELSKEDAELLRASLEAVARQSKILAKEKFTRKDYRK